MSTTGKDLSNPYSTGGGGVHFENRVQASFVVLMLTGGFSPCLPTWPIKEIKLQGKYLDFDTDDLIIYVKQPGSEKQVKLLGQIKHSINITKENKVFGEVIQAAWNDFNNNNIFNEETDEIALITGPLSAADTDHVRALLNQARYSKNANDFVNRVNLGKFTSEIQRKKLDVFKIHLKKANSNVDLTDDQIWRFMKKFHLLIYDLDIKGVTLSLLHSLIGQYSINHAEGILALIEKDVTYKSENAGVITFETIPENIKKEFLQPVKKAIPDDLIRLSVPATKKWNHHEFASKLAFANLLGSWNEKNKEDIKLIEQLTNEAYSKWIFKIREIIQQPESPLKLKNGLWNISIRENLWIELGPRIFDDTLDIFKECAVKVLSESDPKFTLTSDQRFAASLYGKELKYSHALREGIAESLVLFRTHSDAFSNCSLNKPEMVVNLAVREIFKNADWVLWGSLNNLLPLLAEAAPKEFLSAVENTLKQTPSPFEKLFAQEGNTVTGTTYLSGLLWALETLAWDEQFLVRVTSILGELATHDPGGMWANRPINSLSTIFLPWFPQTNASVNKRKVALQTLLKEYPEIGWKILLKLLPNQLQTSSGTHKPKWSKITSEEEKDKIDRENYWEQVLIYSDLAVEMTYGDVGKLIELVGLLDHLPAQSFEKIVDYLLSDDITSKPENERFALWLELKKCVSKHKRFAGEKWAIAPVMVSKIETAANNLAPSNPLFLHRILFCNNENEFFEEKGNWDEQQQLLEKRRQKAMKEIIDCGGIGAVFQFAKTVESPAFVGFSLGFIGKEDVDKQILPKLLETEDKRLLQFVGSFVWGRQRSQGWAWIDQINFSQWTNTQIGQFLSFLPFNTETWDRVNRLLGDFEEVYWSRTTVKPYQTGSELDIAIDKLIKYKRPNAAIDCLNKMLHFKKRLDNARTVQALLAAIHSTEPIYTRDTYNIVKLIKALQDDSESNLDDLLQIEWAYLPLLDRYSGAFPKILENQLANEPEFFAEMIRNVYRSKKESPAEKELTAIERAVAENAYRLLNEWRIPPGMQKDGSFSGNNFKNWLEQTIKLCEESGHLEVALSHIGSVLIYCPPDPNGLWINRTVAEVLNGRDAEKIRNGFYLGVINSRGVHFVDPTGKPERDLASKYRKQAENIENAGYFRFADTMRSITESYDREAEEIINEQTN